MESELSSGTFQAETVPKVHSSAVVGGWFVENFNWIQTEVPQKQ
jgi:hypothetical protein